MVKYLPFLLILVWGCGSPPPPKPVADPGLAARHELSAKFRGMTPAERSAYAKAHPDEMRNALQGLGMGGSIKKTPPP